MGLWDSGQGLPVPWGSDFPFEHVGEVVGSFLRLQLSFLCFWEQRGSVEPSRGLCSSGILREPRCSLKFTRDTLFTKLLVLSKAFADLE